MSETWIEFPTPMALPRKRLETVIVENYAPLPRCATAGCTFHVWNERGVPLSTMCWEHAHPEAPASVRP